MKDEFEIAREQIEQEKRERDEEINFRRQIPRTDWYGHRIPAEFKQPTFWQRLRKRIAGWFR